MIKIKLQRLLDKKDMSRSQLSQKTGIRKDTIGMYCDNTIKRINKADLDKICKVLKCKLNDLIEFVPDKKNAPGD